MIKFERLGDEEGNVEFTELLVETSSNSSSNRVFCQNGRNWFSSLNRFQKISLALMTTLVFLILLLLVVTSIGSRNSHHKGPVQGITATTPQFMSAMMTKYSPVTTSTTRSQDAVTYALRNSVSDIISLYNRRKILHRDGVFFELSTSNDSSRDTVGISRAMSLEGVFVTTSSSEKRTTTANNHTDKTGMDIVSVKNHDADDGVSRAKSPGAIFVTTSSSAKRTSIANNGTEMAPDRTAMDVVSVKKHGDDAGFSRAMSPGAIFVTAPSSAKRTTIANHGTEMSPDRTAVDVVSIKEQTENTEASSLSSDTADRVTD